jgi:hypothetical protein
LLHDYAFTRVEMYIMKEHIIAALQSQAPAVQVCCTSIRVTHKKNKKNK